MSEKPLDRKRISFTDAPTEENWIALQKFIRVYGEAINTHEGRPANHLEGRQIAFEAFIDSYRAQHGPPSKAIYYVHLVTSSITTAAGWAAFLASLKNSPGVALVSAVLGTGAAAYTAYLLHGPGADEADRYREKVELYAATVSDVLSQTKPFSGVFWILDGARYRLKQKYKFLENMDKPQGASLPHRPGSGGSDAPPRGGQAFAVIPPPS